MQWITRRNALLAAGTVAFATAPRKPSAQTILTPKPDAPPRLQGITSLVPTTPPTPPNDQKWQDVEGKTVGIGDFLGTGLVLNLWATWCIPCVAEMPALDALAERLKSENIQVMPISSDRGGVPVVQKFYTARDIRHLGIWTDPKGVAARGWGARGLPTTLIIDRMGREAGRLEGAAEWASTEALEAIRRLVG